MSAALSAAESGDELRALAGPPADAQGEEPARLAAIEAELIEQADLEEPAEPEQPIALAGGAELPDTLMRIVDARINIWRKLAEMDRRREEIQSLAGEPEIADEIQRQCRELKKVPARDVLDKTIGRLRERRANPAIKVEQASARGRNRPGEVDPRQLYVEVLDLGVQQVELLLKRSKLDPAVAPAALPAAASEPLLKLCRTVGTNADALVGWTYYAMGVLQRAGHYQAIQDDYNRRLGEAQAEDRRNKGLRAVLVGSRVAEVPPLDASVGEILRAARYDLAAIEPQLTEMFWALYEELAWLLARSETGDAGRPLSADQATTVRMFLRYGLVSTHPSLVKSEVAAFIQQDCIEDVHTWENAPDTTHVVYADEYIIGVARKRLTVSPDEDLELNQRGSPAWRADRVWRQAAIGQVRAELIERRLRELADCVSGLRKQAQAKEERYELLRADGRKTQAAAVSHELVGIKGQISRLTKAIERVELWVLPKVKDQAEEASVKLADKQQVLGLEAVVRREARFVRRAARLAGRLKEPFGPFVLRDHFEPSRSDHHSRKAVLDAIRKIEEADRFMFHQVLVPNKKLARRITVRMSPTFLLPPCRGQVAFSFCERQWDDNGRLVLPLIAYRQGSLEDMIVNMLADFRWDCSMEEAGMDWIAADALCAAYAAVRWAVRKLPEKTQNMMGIDPNLKDKPNWRAHYRLFVRSAKDAGRLLFNKCDDIYKMVVKYIGLPEGVEVLRRD